MVLDVIALERHSVRNANSQIRDDGQTLIRSDGSKGEVMCDLVDRQKGVLIEGTAYNVGCDDKERGERVSMAKCDGYHELGEKHDEYQGECHGCRTHEGSHLVSRSAWETSIGQCKSDCTSG